MMGIPFEPVAPILPNLERVHYRPALPYQANVTAILRGSPRACLFRAPDLEARRYANERLQVCKHCRQRLFDLYMPSRMLAQTPP